jgi:enoyl-[acyl-carrier protein] reductase/trans-2-enoyl-CoA reductase (NAD+)
MIIQPKVRGFVCVTSHPEGCAQHVQQQIAWVRKGGAIDNGPKNVLILGASTGYGLASRIVAAFGCNAKTVGVFFERPSAKGKPASPGWYNSVAFEKAANDAGIYAASVNGDAFSDELKAQTIELIQRDLGKVDMVIYSLASPRRTDPDDGITYRSCLKPIGEPFTANNLDTDRKVIAPITIEPASTEEIVSTVKVMGGEDWQRWIDQLDAAGVLADNCSTIAYDYIGPEVTWPVYHNGTIGQAKKHLRETADRIHQSLQPKGGSAYISVNKAVVTQASSAIPVVPLYISILFKVMKEAGIHEDCIQQIDRLFRDRLCSGQPVPTDDQRRIRMDDWEMRDAIQAQVKALWQTATTDSIDDTTDFAGYQANFLQLFGFGLDGVDYNAPSVVDLPIPSIKE